MEHGTVCSNSGTARESIANRTNATAELSEKMLPANVALRRSRDALRSALRTATTWNKPGLVSEMPAPGGGARIVTVLPGDGIGPEVIKAAQAVVAATGE